ncbi:MAG: hypothetical protein KBA66_22370 [Leptospiraceae bacterium]|nr:hypothetical protein [Leptospiraceae bacterium]
MRISVKLGLVAVLFLYFVNCASTNIHVKSPEQKLIYSFSDLPVETKKSFEVVETNWYWFGMKIGSGIDVDAIIRKEIYYVRDPKGVKNLKVKVFNKTWFAYSFLPNPAGIISSTYTAVIGSVLGFTNRSFHVQGEIF